MGRGESKVALSSVSSAAASCLVLARVCREFCGRGWGALPRFLADLAPLRVFGWDWEGMLELPGFPSGGTFSWPGPSGLESTTSAAAAAHFWCSLTAYSAAPAWPTASAIGGSHRLSAAGPPHAINLQTWDSRYPRNRPRSGI